jgi:hypothetical protein
VYNILPFQSLFKNLPFVDITNACEIAAKENKEDEAIGSMRLEILILDAIDTI